MSEVYWQDVIETERPRLLALGYRMTGSKAVAEDILQDTWLRIKAVALDTIVSPERWLSTVVMRLCLDYLRKAKREDYVGPWLPEPLLADKAQSSEERFIEQESVGMGLVLMLDRLSPIMRAAVLLHDAFDYTHSEVAAALGIDAASSRQMISRARKRMAAFPTDLPDTPQARALAAAFWRASRDGQFADLMALMAPDVVVITDGGGKVYAALNPVIGAQKAARLFLGLARKRKTFGAPVPVLHHVNGGIGFISVEDGHLQTTTFGMQADGSISAIWICRNPDKLLAARRALRSE